MSWTITGKRFRFDNNLKSFPVIVQLINLQKPSGWYLDIQAESFHFLNNLERCSEPSCLWEPWPPWLKDIKLRMKPLVFTAALVRGYFPVRCTLLLLCLYTEQKYIFSSYWVLIPWIEIQELLISARKCAQKAYFSYFFVQIHIYSQLWDLKLTA